MADNPEMDFIDARLRELRAELKKGEEALGVHVTPENIGLVLAGVTDALHRSGNEALAMRYVSAFHRYEAALEAERRILTAGEVNEAANDAMNDAQEDFERVAADVSAWFDDPDQGGA